MNGLVLMSADSVQALGWMLLHFVWQGFAAAAILAGTRVVIKDPRLRYTLACTVLLTMVSLAAYTFLTQEFERRPQPGPSGVSTGIPLLADAPSPSSTFTPDPPPRLRSSESSLPDRWTRLTTRLQDHIPGIVICWLVGVLLLSLRLFGGCWVCFRLKQTGTNPLPDTWQTRVKDLEKRLNISHRVSVVASSVASVPMIVGVFRPVVLIPIASLMGLTSDQLEAILIHELAHVRRYDNLVNLLQRLVETVFFFHPAVWWVSGCIRTEREHCCDDVAASAGDPKLYAVALTTLEGLRTPGLATAATGGPLLSRIRRLLAVDGTGGRDGLAGYTVVSLASILAVLMLATFVVEGTQVKEATNAGSDGDQPMNVMVDVTPSKQGETLPRCLGPLMQTVGRSEWSIARLRGVMGHAFHFEMREGGVGFFTTTLTGDSRWTSSPRSLSSAFTKPASTMPTSISRH